MSAGHLTIREAWCGGGHTGGRSVLPILSQLAASEILDLLSTAAEEGCRS